MMKQIVAKVFGTKHDRDMKRLRPLVEAVNSHEAAMKKLSDEGLRNKTLEFRERLKKGESLDSLLPEAFATVREASIRVLGMRHYDVQLIGGMVLHQGKIAEMRTGEGKTLVATLPVYLNALTSAGVHVVTVNDYLARRDAEWMGRLYKFLGMTVGIIVHDLSDRQRRDSYACDITYGTNNEFGFDYLRDNMKYSLKDYVQRPFNYAIVDECDSILVDEARTPLIISGPSEESTDKYYTVNKIIPYLQKDLHFVMEEKSKTASLTEAGNAKVEELLNIENLYDPRHIELLHHVYQGLKAHHLYRLDVEYMVKDGEIIIVDEFTGRLMPGRRWSDGLHQAIEAKEGVTVKSENQTLATITFQNYFRMYKKMAGMTGTADTEAVEFKKIYNLDVVVIPTNKPIQRKDEDDVVYKTEEAKFGAIVKDIQERHAKGQPVLVGTVSIEKSEKLSAFLRRHGVPHNVLNAKHHEREAEIIAQAGRKGSVTIATNMAGRGTDIVLGGNPEGLARRKAAEGTPEYDEELRRLRSECESERTAVVGAGGLYIVGTERHESRRIDNQLRGRSGRQGDPGESRFFLSLEDNLMRIFNGERIQKIMSLLKVPDDEPIVAPMVTRAIEGAQRKVEGHNFDMRKHLLDYDDVMNKQRSSVYSLRREVLEGEKVDDIIREMLSEVTSDILDMFAPEGSKRENWDLQGLQTAVLQQFGVGIQFEGDLHLAKLDNEKLVATVRDAIKEAYDRQRQHMGPLLPQVQRMLALQAIDIRWKEHLLRVDHLKEGINLRAWAQKDPLIEYKKEAFKIFEEMHRLIRSETLEKLFKIQIDVQPVPEGEAAMGADADEELEALRPQAPRKVTLSHPEANSAALPRGGPLASPSSRGPEPVREPQRQTGPKVGRNDPCPCGSGKKYKKCHGAGLAAGDFAE